MGSPQFSVPTLKVLAKSLYQIMCVYTQPPKKALRGQNIVQTPIQEVAENLKIGVRSPNDLNDENEFKYFKSLKPDFVVVVAYGKIIPKKYLSLARSGFINIHASLLPKWRGAAPIQRSIMNRDKKSGISFMKIEEGLDEGPFCKQISVDIDNKTTAKILSDKLSKLGAENIIDCLNAISEKKANFTQQISSQVSYAGKIKKTEAKIDWTNNANVILAKINGLNPDPGAWFEHEGFRFKIWKAVLSDLNGKPGEILDETMIIGCKEKSIKILEIQKEGKNRLFIDDFLSGNKMIKGKTIS